MTRSKRNTSNDERVRFTLTSYHERILLELRALLWPDGGPQAVDADTLDTVAQTLDRHGYGRRKR